MTVTLDQVQVLADQLNVIDRARLAAHLYAQLAQDLAADQGPAPAQPVAADAWTRRLAFRGDIEALGDDAPDFAAQLESDRQTRAATLDELIRVHP